MRDDPDAACWTERLARSSDVDAAGTTTPVRSLLGRLTEALAALLSALAFDHLFLEPRHSLLVSEADLPCYISFVFLVAMLVHRKRREEQIRALDAQLKRRRAELEALNDELEAFAYSISHDVRRFTLPVDAVAPSAPAR